MSDEHEALGIPYVEPQLRLHSSEEPYVTLGVRSFTDYIQKPSAEIKINDAQFANTLLSNLLYHVKKIEDLLEGKYIMKSNDDEDRKITAFNAASVLKEMNDEAEKVVANASVVLEETRNFLLARGKNPS